MQNTITSNVYVLLSTDATAQLADNHGVFTSLTAAQTHANTVSNKENVALDAFFIEQFELNTGKYVETFTVLNQATN